MDDLAWVLQELSVLKGEMDRLAAEIPGRLPVHLVLRPEPGPPRERPDPRTPVPPPWTPEQVLEFWSHCDRADPFKGLGRRYVGAICAATSDPRIGPLLSGAPGFVAGLVQAALPRQLLPALARTFFHAFPPASYIHAAIASQSVEPAGRILPRWWGAWSWEADHNATADSAVAWLAEHAASTDWTALSQEQDLPDALPDGPWAEQIVARAPIDGQRPEALHRAVRLLRFADSGKTLGAGYAIRPATRLAIKRLVRVGQARPEHRVPIAGLLRERVGDPFRVADEARWNGLEDERRMLRAWIAGEVLDLLFTHLQPNTIHRSHTEPRRKFWKGYSQRVDRLWLLVEHGLSNRLIISDVQRLKDTGMVNFRWMDAAQQQAVVWMHLRNQAGQVVTVVEGNANASVRMRAGAWEPPAGATINYSGGVVNGDLSELHGRTRRHMEGWEARLRDDLYTYGIYP